MRIKIEINSKELNTLTSDTNEQIQFDFEADVTTEARKLTEHEENIVFGSAMWALLCMLPHTLVRQYFNAWNVKVQELHEQWQQRLKEELAKVKPNIKDE